jgi:glycosyltransferase involved in cell wall biosynthesis
MISVVITTCNRPQNFSTALKSVVDQDYNEMEIIVIDDNSQNSIEIDEYSNNIRYFKFNKNVGACVARNKGIEIAKGHFVAFLDDDDIWTSGKLSKQIKMFNTDVVLCYTGKTIVNKKIKLNRYSYSEPIYTSQLKSICKRNFIGTISSILVKRSVLEEVGGFDPKLTALQDLDLYIRILNKYKCIGINEPLVYYNQDSSVNRISTNHYNSLESFLYLCDKYTNHKYRDLIKRNLIMANIKKSIKNNDILLLIKTIYSTIK